MTTAPKRRWPRYTLRTLFVLVTVAGALTGWFRWNAIQVRERKEFIAYLEGLEHESNPTTVWVMRWHHGYEKIPWGWRVMGATNKNWGTWLLCNQALTSHDLEKAERLLPDCEIEVDPIPRAPARPTH